MTQEMEKLPRSRSGESLEATLTKCESGLGCEGCLAATGTFLCDLGMQIQAVWKDHVQIGATPLFDCPRPEQLDDYLVEHLKKM